MSTPTDSERVPGAPPRWLLPMLVGMLIVLAGVVAVVITGRTPAAVAPAPVAPAAAEAPTAAAAAEGHGGLNPDGPAVAEISLAEARAHLDTGTAIFIDLRAGSAYAAGHIPGALTITSRELESRIAGLPEGTLIIAYGDSDRADSGRRGAQIFMELGYPPVIALEGGFQQWQASGHPVEQGP